jgi:hypothetical protein
MIVEVNLTQMIFLAIALFSALWAAAKLFYAMFEKSQDKRFEAMTVILEKNQETTLQLERDFLKFQSEIPRVYLRRDDYTRETQTLHEAIRAEIAPLRISVGRIEDYLIHKP